MMRLIKTGGYIYLFLQSCAINSFSLVYPSSFRSYVGQASGIGSLSRSFVSKIGSLQVPESEKQGVTINNVGFIGKSSSIQVKMQQLSNIASMLCVLDCTILPLVSVLLPLLGFTTATIGSTSADSLLHSIGHTISLYFVVPVGSLTTVVNLIMSSNQKTSGRKRIKAIVSSGLFILSCLGLLLLYTANSHGIPQLIMKPLSHLVSPSFLHDLHSHNSNLHKAANIIGSGLLILSNLLSRRIFGCRHSNDHGSCDDHAH